MRLPSAELPKVQNSNYGTSFKKRDKNGTIDSY